MSINQAISKLRTFFDALWLNSFRIETESNDRQSILNITISKTVSFTISSMRNLARYHFRNILQLTWQLFMIFSNFQQFRGRGSDRMFLIDFVFGILRNNFIIISSPIVIGSTGSTAIMFLNKNIKNTKNNVFQ